MDTMLVVVRNLAQDIIESPINTQNQRIFRKIFRNTKLTHTKSVFLKAIAKI